MLCDFYSHCYIHLLALICLVTLCLSIRDTVLKIFSIVFRVVKATFKSVSWNSSVLFSTSFIVYVKVPHFIFSLSPSDCVFYFCRENFCGSLVI
jgi:hypothetical protein